MSEELNEVKVEDKTSPAYAAHQPNSEQRKTAGAVTGAGGAVKNRRGDLKKKVDPTVDDVEDHVKTPQKGMAEAMESLFDGEELSEAFMSKAEVIFESAVNARVNELREEIEAQFDEALQEETTKVVEEITEQVDQYLNYVIEGWMEENRVALEAGYKVHVAESLMDGLKSLFTEHNIPVDEETQDVASELESKIAKLEENYDRVVNEVIELREAKSTLEREMAFDEITEGLTDTQIERLRSLAEDISYKNLDDFTRKVEVLKESFVSDKKYIREDKEEVEFISEETEAPKAKITDPTINEYVKGFDKLFKV